MTTIYDSSARVAASLNLSAEMELSYIKLDSLTNEVTQMFENTTDNIEAETSTQLLNECINTTKYTTHMLLAEISRAESSETRLAADLLAETFRATRRESALATSATVETGRLSFLRLADNNRTSTAEAVLLAEINTMKAAASLNLAALILNFTTLQAFVLQSMHTCQIIANETIAMSVNASCLAKLCL